MHLRRTQVLTLALIAATGALMTSPTAPAQISSQTSITAAAIPTDKYAWLEDVYGDKPMAWVKAENERSAKVLEADPRFATLEAASLKVLESPDRIPYPTFREGAIYNTWQD